MVPFLSPMCRCHALLVLSLKIGTSINEEFDHLEAISLDGVVDGSLVLGVSDIDLSSQVDQVLDDPDVALSHGIVDGCLPVLVLSVENIRAALLDKVADDIEMTFSRSVEKWDLLE